MLNLQAVRAGTTLSVMILAPLGAFALPSGGTVVGGAPVATIDYSTPNTVNINQTATKAIIDWNSFNISTHETANFNQPTNGVALNRIHDADPTRIFGKLNATGTVMLVNKNGFLFGPTAKVDVGNLVATTSSINETQFNNATSNYRFTLPAADRPNATIRNMGEITVDDGGVAALVAPNVVNEGTINARLGKVNLAGGQAFTLDLFGDGLVNLTTQPAKSGKVTQAANGKIIADGGMVQLSAAEGANMVNSVINLDGVVQASTVGTKNGRIILNASEANVNTTSTAKSVKLDNTKLDINQGIKLVADGGQVDLIAGTYDQGNKIVRINKSVTVSGAGKDRTTIDASDVGPSWGVIMTADNSELNEVTVKGPTANGNAIKITGDEATDQTIKNVRLVNVAAKGSGRSEIDIHGAEGIRLRNVTADGQGTAGVGIAITDSKDVRLTNTTTTGNNWGGIGIYSSGRYFPAGVDDVRIEGSNSFGEDVAMYTEKTAGDITRIRADDMLFNTRAAGKPTQSLYHTNRDAALRTALGLVAGGDNSAVIEGMNLAPTYLATNNKYTVGSNGVQDMSIQSAFTAMQNGGEIDILAGDYNLASEFQVNKSATIKGAGMGSTILNAANNGGYGIIITADDTTLQGFTLNGPAADVGSAYGIKVEPDTLVRNDTINNITLRDLKVQGSGRSEIDLHAARNVTLDNVIADGQGTKGYGIGITDSRDVTLNNVQTLNNLWGGVFIHARGTYYDGGVDDIALTGTNSFAELNPLTVQESNGNTATNLLLTDFTHAVRASVAPGLSYYQQSQGQAVNFALNLSPDTSTVEEQVTGTKTEGNNTFIVGRDATRQMSIQTALDAVDPTGIVNILAGNYDLPGTLNVTKNVTLNGAGRNQTRLDARNIGNAYGILVNGDGATLQNFTLRGGNGGNANYGIKIETPVGSTDPASLAYQDSIEDVTLRNLTVRNFGRSEIDINGGRNILLQNVLADGNGTAGNGVGITDSRNVTLRNVTTKDNLWGGVRVTAGGGYHQPLSRNIRVLNSDLQEPLPFYTEAFNGGVVRNLTLPGFNFALSSVSLDALLGGSFDFYQANRRDALDFADALIFLGATDVVAERQSHNGFTVGSNRFLVGTNMSLQSAADAARDGGVLRLLKGTYTLTNPLAISGKSLRLVGQGVNRTTIDARPMFDAFALSNGADAITRRLTLLVAQQPQNPGEGEGGNTPNPDTDLISRQNRQTFRGFGPNSNVIGGADLTSLIEPAAGEDDSTDDLGQMPLRQDDLAVAQYFINSGNIATDQQAAIRALLEQAAKEE